MKELTANEFSSATASGVSLVDFSTEWCAPCKTMLPIVQRIAGDYAGRVSVFSVDAEKEQELAMRQAVMSFPTFLILKNGKVVDRVVGAIADPKLRAKIDAVL
jgi:thioredoxin 1